MDQGYMGFGICEALYGSSMRDGRYGQGSLEWDSNSTGGQPSCVIANVTYPHK